MMKKILGATLSAAMTVGLMTAGVTGTIVFAEDNTADTKEADDKLLDGTDMKIGCVFADLGNTSYVAMGKAMEAEAKDHGAEFILKDTGNDSSTLVDVIENFISSGCNVIIEQNSDPGVTETVNQEAMRELLFFPLIMRWKMQALLIWHLTMIWDIRSVPCVLTGQMENLKMAHARSVF